MFCYWNTGCPYKYFGAKTPYNFVRGDIRDSLVKITDCEPISIWAFMRHGKRNPSEQTAKDMIEAMFIKDDIVTAYENGSSTLCAQDIDNLRNWVLDKNIFDQLNQLSKEGYEESLGIGRRLKEAFPNLLAELGKEDYTFRSVKSKWVQDSIKGFVEGLGSKNLNIDPPKDDYDSLAPYKSCNKYLRDVENTNETNLEAEKYQIHSEFLASKDRLHRRLGINYPIADVNMIALWNWCRLTSSGIQNEFSHWCALFTTEDLKVLEYREDLERYYKNGYGMSMNKMFGETVLSDLLKTFQDAKIYGKKVTAYFTHAPMMDMIYTALGLFKDPYKLTGTERRPDRKWRTSKFSTFSNNLIAVLNRCGKQRYEDYNVVFYLNEEPLRTICKAGVCTWKEFEDKLSPFLNTNTDFCE
ncbi:unnamed protein product [Arctia plantaginis]|uniref:Multiple inositol polyphosphate phosphatase 1 n=1 Tax=Arctia plantaginis TaxID=874455 RepID=A0A8S1ABX5_ARCPL|nr:unnamed protein product [Arctia plantaginis]